jgi:hypothetical protein
MILWPGLAPPTAAIERARQPDRRLMDEGNAFAFQPSGRIEATLLAFPCPVYAIFEAKHRRATTDLAESRNRFIAALADEIFVAHAAMGSKIERFCREFLNEGKRVLTLQADQNRHLLGAGVGVFSL